MTMLYTHTHIYVANLQEMLSLQQCKVNKKQNINNNYYKKGKDSLCVCMYVWLILPSNTVTLLCMFIKHVLRYLPPFPTNRYSFRYLKLIVPCKFTCVCV